MILVDTSVWIDFLRSGDDGLAHLLNKGAVCIHPMVIGELACGRLQNRAHLLDLLQNLPKAVVASHEEAMHLLESQKLMGEGIGYIDLHLLAATQLGFETRIWTRDKRLARVAQNLSVDARFTHTGPVEE